MKVQSPSPDAVQNGFVSLRGAEKGRNRVDKREKQAEGWERAGENTIRQKREEKQR